MRVIIVGGGVIGCAIAFELASRHRAEVRVLERAVPGAEASSAAAGILGAQVEAHQPGALFDLMIASRERHRELDARLRESVGFGTGFHRCGVLEVDATEGRYAWQRERNLAVRTLDAKEARALEPALADSITGAIHLRDEAQLDPPLLLRALQQACAVSGVLFVTGAIARGVARRSERVVGVELEDRVIEGDAVVIAAGSWSSMVAGLPQNLRRVRPVRGQIVQVETRPPIVRNIVFGPRGYVVARPDGRTLLGSTMEEAGHRKEVTAGGVHAVLSHALSLLPSLAQAPITATWAGFRPATPEDRPMLGVVEPGLFSATGHHRNGVLLSAETARLISDLVATGRCERDLSPFSPTST